jgi:hypothetical protein
MDRQSHIGADKEVISLQRQLFKRNACDARSPSGEQSSGPLLVDNRRYLTLTSQVDYRDWAPFAHCTSSQHALFNSCHAT